VRHQRGLVPRGKERNLFMETLLKLVFGVGLVLAIIAGFAAVAAYPTKWLVNYVFTDQVRLSLFGVAQIGFWRALALNFMCGILFKGSSSSSSSSKS
jgi:hypothetical protein